MAGLYFEQFDVGQRFEHLVRRTVTETDNLLFSALTMNPAAIHLDAEYCQGHRLRGAPRQQRLHPRAAGGPVGVRHHLRHDHRQPRLGGRALSRARC